MRLSIPLPDGVSNDLLQSLRFGPGLTVIERADAGVGSEEWVEDACLVLLNEIVTRGMPIKAWEISAQEDEARDAKVQCHLQEARDVSVTNLAVTSPKCTIALLAQESRSAQHERSLLAVISSNKTVVRSTLHQGAISIVDPPVFDNSAVSHDVRVVHRHAVLAIG